MIVSEKNDGQGQARRYDRFRERVMFPIRNVKGSVIGFGGRVLDGGEPKYLNSPETPLFSKGSELYGLFEARLAIRELGYVLVVEGYMDVVALAQLGFANAVATLGTACTPIHVQKLFRQTDTVVFSFDGDSAGRRAARRALDACLPHAADNRTIRFLFLPAEHDPDSYVREFGTDGFGEQVDRAMPLSQFMLNEVLNDKELDQPEGRAKRAVRREAAAAGAAGERVARADHAHAGRPARYAVRRNRGVVRHRFARGCRGARGAAEERAAPRDGSGTAGAAQPGDVSRPLSRRWITRASRRS